MIKSKRSAHLIGALLMSALLFSNQAYAAPLTAACQQAQQNLTVAWLAYHSAMTSLEEGLQAENAAENKVNADQTTIKQYQRNLSDCANAPAVYDCSPQYIAAQQAGLAQAQSQLSSDEYALAEIQAAIPGLQQADTAAQAAYTAAQIAAQQACATPTPTPTPMSHTTLTPMSTQMPTTGHR